MATEPHRFVSPEEYLEFERKAEFKSELYDGVIYAMAGASRRHNIIGLNVGGGLNSRLAERDCEVYAGDMRVLTPFRVNYFYPDVVVVCGEPGFEDAKFDTLLNPTVIIEVLSPSTESFDRGRKFDSYRLIESLQEYLMILQDECRLLQYTRQEDGQWMLRELTSMDGVVQLESIECALPVAEIYRKVDFEPI